MTKKYVVLGAGSIGISTALQLQQRGLSVSLIDRDLPASATSYGNAGVVNNCSFYPVNNPSLWKKIPRLLGNNRPELRYNLKYLLNQPGWIYSFLRSSSTNRTKYAATSLASLISAALDEHKALMQRVGNMHRLNESGWLKLYRQTPVSNFGEIENQLYIDNDIQIDVLSRDDVYSLEPHLKQIFTGGYLLKDSASVNNPGMLLNEYFQHFQNHGGSFLQCKVESIQRESGGYHLTTDTESLHADVLVVSSGIWSPVSYTHLTLPTTPYV